MATPIEDTPKWFDANYYLEQKAAQMQAADPAGTWTPAAVLKNFAEAGIDNPYDHYKDFGDVENLSPNALFDNTEYLAAKAAIDGPLSSPAKVADDIHKAGLTYMEHYIKFGGKYENLSPSSDFDQNKYFDAKLQAHIAAEPDKGWTLGMVKDDFATAGISALEHYLTYGAMEGLDKYDYSVNGDPIPHPGNTNIQLTKGADTVAPDATVAALKTSDRDDTIHALAGSSTTSTLNAGDVIDGGAGVDKLIVDMQQTFNGFTKGSMKGVEQVVLQNAGNATFKAVNVEGVQNYVVDGSVKGGVTIESVESADVNYNVKMDKGNFTAKIVDSALTGKTDDVYMILNGVGSDKAASVISVEGMTAKEAVEGLTLDVRGADNYVSLLKGHETVTVEGKGNLTVGVADGLKSFNASDATGKITANLINAGADLKTINGGLGDDTISVAGLVAGAVVDGGEGKDTLKLGALANARVTNTITDVEVLEVTATTNANAATINLTNVTGLETFKIEGTGGATDAFTLTGATDYSTLNLEVSNKLGTVGNVAYNGSGELNVVHSGAKASGSATAITGIIAADVTGLNISNEAAFGSLTIGTLNVGAVETITIDTGDASDLGVNIGGSSKMDELGSVTVAGAGEAKLILGGSAKNFDTIDATDLQGDLTVNLTSMTLNTKETMTINGTSLSTNDITMSGGNDKLVFNGGAGISIINGGASDDNLTIYANGEATTVNGDSGDDTITVIGNGGATITGGAGADVITLGSGYDVVKFTATSAANVTAEGGDNIKGFETGSDVIQFAGALLGLTLTADTDAAFNNLGAGSAAVSLLTGQVNELNLVGLGNNAAVNAGSVATALTAASVSLAVASSALLAIDNGSNTYLWHVISDTTAAIVASELKLVGVLEGVTGADAFAHGDVWLTD